MKIVINHMRNPLLGWDINVSVAAADGEAITGVEVKVNDFPEIRDTLRKPLDSWEEQITQKGVFPGDNKVEVTVRDQDDEETRALQKWS